MEEVVNRSWRHKGGDVLTYVALAIAGEAGEVANCRKKMLRDGWSEGVERNLLIEASDVLYYVTRLAQIYGLTLADLANIQAAKIDGRLGDIPAIISREKGLQPPIYHDDKHQELMDVLMDLGIGPVGGRPLSQTAAQRVLQFATYRIKSRDWLCKICGQTTRGVLEAINHLRKDHEETQV